MKQDGMEVLQVLLIAGLSLVLIVTIFYQPFVDFFGDVMDTVTTWFTNKGSEAFK
jgi:hypothetical protein